VGYKTNASFASVTCYDIQQAFDMEAFNMAAPWEAVYFNSRPDPEGKSETVQLMAWLLKTNKPRPPYDNGKPPPRIVVQHGVGSNQNNRFTQYLAYELRAMGFDVLAPGFRNHGWSGKTKHERCSWGWTYPLDLMGAWDYAVNDPEGKFGGPMDVKLVGIAGVSLGAMTTSTVFGMEKRVQAAWIDSGPHDPRTELEAQIGMIPQPLRGLLMPGIWSGANWWVGVPLDRYIPPKALPCEAAPYLRHAAVVSSMLDTFVPAVSQDNLVVDLLASSPKCYVVDQVFFPKDSCDGMYHGYSMYLSPDQYRVHLCKFFTKAFNLTCSYCQLGTLPWYTMKTAVEQNAYIDAVCSMHNK
jgi:pimeloyl-ACP methyl ester carboxylesterase